MGLFQKLFKRQPGGSIVGNILRGVGDKVTGGLVSKLLPAPKTESQNAIEEAAKTINANKGINGGLVPDTSKPATTTKKNTPYIIGGILAVAGVLWLIFKPRKKGYKRRY